MSGEPMPKRNLAPLAFGPLARGSLVLFLSVEVFDREIGFLQLLGLDLT